MTSGIKFQDFPGFPGPIQTLYIFSRLFGSAVDDKGAHVKLTSWPGHLVDD